MVRWLGLAIAALSLGAASPAPRDTWTPAWTASMWEVAGDAAIRIEDATLRSTIRVGAGGNALRLRLSNEYGAAPVRIGGATLRTADGRVAVVTFGGAREATIAIGAPLVSDAATLKVDPFALVEVSLYLPGHATIGTIHHSRGDPVLVSIPGDHSGEAEMPVAKKLDLRPLIAGIDVRTAKPRPVVVAYGDWITDNINCPNEAPVICRWGDALGRRFAAAGMPHVVVTQAISGNRILAPNTGPSALARFDRDVLAMPGVTHVVLLEGINDIGGSGLTRNGATNPVVTSDALIQGYRQLVLRAHDRGVKVIAMTILPFEGAFYYSPEREALRVAINEWIRTSGSFDGVIDMEKVVADPANPKRLATGLQGGDNLHPDARGETAMAAAIPLGMFR